MLDIVLRLATFLNCIECQVKVCEWLLFSALQVASLKVHVTVAGQQCILQSLPDLEQPSAPLTTFFPLPRSHQALLGGDDTARLLHPTPAARRQHGRHLPGAPLSAGHRPGANHSTQHWHHLHYW